MAGRPKRRAKLAGQAARDPLGTPQVYVDPLDSRRAAGQRPHDPLDAIFAPLAAGVQLGVGPAKKLSDQERVSRERELSYLESKADRELVRRWWAEELAGIEAGLAQRKGLLEAAGEHPSELVAREVLAFAARGIPKDVAATLLGMSAGELERHYGREYAAGCAEVIARAAENMMRIATSTNDRVAVKALTEFLNRRGGEEWRAPAQKLQIEDGREKGGNVIDSARLTWEDRQLLRGIIERNLGQRQIEGEGADE